MSRPFILALLLLSVCLTSTCEAQLFRRGALRRSNQANYQQQQYRQQAYQQYCNQRQDGQASNTQSTLYVLPNGRYAVRRDGRYYYAQPGEIQANLQQQQSQRNAYAQQMYGQQATQSAQIRSANSQSMPAQNRAGFQTQPTPIDLPTSSATVISEGGTIIEGPAIVGPVVESVPTLAPTENVIQQVDGSLPVGEIPPAADIPTSDEPTAEGENKQNFSVLEDGGKK